MKKVFVFIILLMVGCSNDRYDGHYKVGSPYKIKNKTYHPKDVKQYEQIGLASWYGPGFHGKRTANKEVYNKRDMTAAHRTLPLPSLVRVTNLSNRKSVIVRINDRGPFAQTHNRIIDLSEKAAEMLGIKEMGVAEVKVQYLPKSTDVLHKNLQLQ